MPAAPAPVPSSFEEQWKPRRRTIAQFGILLTLVLWLGNACRPCYIGAGSVDTSRTFAGTTSSGIQIVEASTWDRPVVHLSNSTDTDYVSFPSWTLRMGELWYWSPDDKSLCRISRSGKKRFIPIADTLIPAKTSRVRLHATSRGILLSFSSGGSSRRQQNLANATGVVYVPAGNPEQAKHLRGLRDARGNASSEEFCGRDVKGAIIYWKNADGPTRTHKLNGASWSAWDFLALTGSFAFVRDDQISLADSDTVLWTRSRGSFSFFGVGFAPNGDAWISEDAMAHTGGVAVLDARTGKLRGWRCKSGSPLRPPFYELDNDLVVLLKQLREKK
jgi:hypothetical protein